MYMIIKVCKPPPPPGIDASKVVLMGDSSGGNLAAAATTLHRDDKELDKHSFPAVRAQVTCLSLH